MTMNRDTELIEWITAGEGRFLSDDREVECVGRSPTRWADDLEKAAGQGYSPVTQPYYCSQPIRREPCIRRWRLTTQKLTTRSFIMLTTA
ncbi:hypothetical protein EVAR_58728_1 [Eumeta japonica]|uniref:Uncharacterized protein n=1 Tax=Eumeta variegata TaxID=151549 RepID=A0A4C1YV07_EUMVA|nr:hypothetical protein EVAR_58728_1 [Eumeta japonica]